MVFPTLGGFKGKALPKGGTIEEEDRSRDWYCPKCRERNFVKRAECFKCRTQKPKDSELAAAPRQVIPATGTTLNGMVKSYNRKGFGFLMCLGTEFGQDIYYTREHLSPKLQTRDIPGQHVTFELHRFPDGKLTAINIRPLGDGKEEAMRPLGGKGFGGCGGGFGGCPSGAASSAGFGAGKGLLGKDDEDRSRDWVCTSCNERNFVKRFECYKCKASRGGGFSEAPAGVTMPPPPQRTFSPHAGSRAVREALAGAGSRSRSPRRKKSKRKKRRHSSSESESSASSRSSDKKKKKSKKKRSRSSSSSSGGRSDSKSSDCKMEEPSGAAGAGAAAAAALRANAAGGKQLNPEVEAAKAEALEELMKLRSVEPKEARMSEWRVLLRKWHPDKNPDRVEIATAVFQFLQKGKAILDQA